MIDRRAYNSTLRPVSKRKLLAGKGKKPPARRIMSVDELRASGLLKRASELPAKSERAKWKAKADKYFSELIRLRDAGPDGYGQCITCQRRAHWRTMDCGHYQSRAHEATRYDERNCNLQCKGCNRFQGGKFREHAMAIDRKHGAGTAQTLADKAGRPCRRTVIDYQFLENTYRERVDLIRLHEPEKYNPPNQ